MTMTVPAPGQVRHMLGGQIAIRVEVDTGAGEGLGALWDSGLWDYNRWGAEDPDWVDLTDYVLGVSIHQGAERWGARYETGTATVTVDNTTGIFTPESGSPDPWFREFRPGRKMRIVAVPDPDTGMRVPLFTGRFEGLIGDPADAGHAITATMQLFDFMGDWAAYNPLETTDTGNQRTDVRVEAALDRYGWPADERDIQVGDHNVTGSTLSDTTLEECQQAADAEGGAFYCSKDGLAMFKIEGLVDHGYPVDGRPGLCRLYGSAHRGAGCSCCKPGYFVGVGPGGQPCCLRPGRGHRPRNRGRPIPVLLRAPLFETDRPAQHQ